MVGPRATGINCDSLEQSSIYGHFRYNPASPPCPLTPVSQPHTHTGNHTYWIGENGYNVCNLENLSIQINNKRKKVLEFDWCFIAYEPVSLGFTSRVNQLHADTIQNWDWATALNLRGLHARIGYIKSLALHVLINILNMKKMGFCWWNLWLSISWMLEIGSYWWN